MFPLDRDAYVGRTFPTETVEISADPNKKLRCDFYSYTRPGLTAFRKVGGDFEPITKEEDLHPGDEIWFDWPFGGMVKVTVNENRTMAASNDLFVSLEFHKGWPEANIGPEWTGSCFGNAKAVARADLR